MGSWTTIIPYNSDGAEYHQTLKLSTEDPLECPFCFVKIEVTHLRGVFWQGKDLQVFLRCKTCKQCFIGYAEEWPSDGLRHIVRLSRGNNKTSQFNEPVNKISPSFVQIYGESEFAEQNNLKQICGVGYRKALEFLIKDYLIKKLSQQEIDIKKKPLGNCIDELIDNKKIKEIAKRATWLGNDETHYLKKWEDKDLNDLKKLIEITVHFISMELEADRYMGEMKDG